MIESGSFTGYAQTPAESIRVAPIEDVLAELSLLNAMT